MIISGGVNIYPQEIENLFVMHPSVSDVAVFGIPNQEFGEEVKAVVQPAAGVEPATTSCAPSCSPTPASTWRGSRCPARSTSSTSCPATRPASSSSAGSAIPTGRDHRTQLV